METPLPNQTLAYRDPTLSIEQRVDDLVSRMTLTEKIDQLVYECPAIERLGIPEYNWWNECLHGVARAGVATVFPQAIGLAATWDVNLMAEVATAIADEARAKHHEFVRQGVRDIYTGLTFWSPNVNIFRDPRWGRGQETYGEDPYLAGRMGVTFIKGLQGDDGSGREGDHLKLVATPKHFAVHSGPESTRHEFDARVSERDLHETYLPAFEACIKEGRAASIMGAYNRMNGEPCCASPTLLQKILGEEWGFEGVVVSDCYAINDIFGGHRVVNTAAEAAALAVNAGCDLECGCVFGALHEAFEQGLIDEATIDRAAKRSLTARFRAGMFDLPQQHPYACIPYEINDSAAHRALSLQAARESIVLLKNDGLLPLAKNLKSIAVIGPLAEDVSALLGNYCGTPSHAVTPLEGIRRQAPAEAVIYTARGCDIAVGVPPLVPVPAACLRPPASDRSAALQGLAGAYFPGHTLPEDNREQGAAFVRVDPLVDFAWIDASPLGGRVTEHFSVRWLGTLIPPVSGSYVLGVRGSSGYGLWLDGRELLPWGSDEHHAITRTTHVDLEAGRLYDVRLEYVNTGRAPEVRLLWAVPEEDGAAIAEAVHVAEQAEVVVLILGLSPELEGEEMPVSVEGFAAGDRTEIALPATQEALLRRIGSLGKPVVLVLLGGSALAVNWANQHLPAILAAWYPGEEGGAAIADVLFGDANPAGRLPVTFYQSLDQLPPFDEYSMAGRTYRYMTGAPLYPFGHGLSYTRFEYDNLCLSPNEIDRDGEVTIAVDVLNAGTRAGDEVVQLYVCYPGSSVPRPTRELRGFTRIHLTPGQRTTVSFTLQALQLAYWSEGTWTLETGIVEVLVGASSDDIRLSGRLSLLPR